MNISISNLSAVLLLTFAFTGCSKSQPSVVKGPEKSEAEVLAQRQQEEAQRMEEVKARMSEGRDGRSN
ncbi:hypothetical protein FHS27_006519 [Rhodopirellula rubra]|uniref:Uncharacterized protein n=1 Tax=Aporhodopirellula rubra TaxID=980271 RepID=A0A7W5E5K6_9BACT|nr:hypothetical protein [Aporhodopirellula rubra]